MRVCVRERVRFPIKFICSNFLRKIFFIIFIFLPANTPTRKKASTHHLRSSFECEIQDDCAKIFSNCSQLGIFFTFPTHTGKNVESENSLGSLVGRWAAVGEGVREIRARNNFKLLQAFICLHGPNARRVESSFGEGWRHESLFSQCCFRLNCRELAASLLHPLNFHVKSTTNPLLMRHIKFFSLKFCFFIVFFLASLYSTAGSPLDTHFSVDSRELDRFTTKRSGFGVMQIKTVKLFTIWEVDHNNKTTSRRAREPFESQHTEWRRNVSWKRAEISSCHKRLTPSRHLRYPSSSPFSFFFAWTVFVTKKKLH